jgi:alpha-1,6-mannosyltransferase
MLLFSIPNLSDDVYRYLWDGRMLANGIHPFSDVPQSFINKNILPSILNQELFAKLNSPNYFTIYPPVAQGVFWLAAKISSENILIGIIVIRVLVISAEIGSILLMKRLIHNFKLPAKNTLLYALNPLVILELTGNLHLEAFMIFFLVLTVYYLQKNKFPFSAIAFSFATCSKLIPLMFLPVILLFMRSIKKSLLYGVVVLFTCLILFTPLFDWEIISGFNESFSYYFKKFEFNASVYYLVREWGFWKYGYNIVQTVGWKLGLISGIGILIYTLISYLKNHQPAYRTGRPITNNLPTGQAGQQLFKDWLWIYGLYLLFITTLHPWYAIPLLAFSVFTHFRFTVLWSFLIFFTYAGYSQNGYTENLWIVFIEYLLVIIYFALEFIRPKFLYGSST